MPRKNVKPQTNLKIDLFLFAFLLVIMISGIEIRTSTLAPHTLLTLQRVHGWAGILMTLLIGLHLLAHFPWIKHQLHTLNRRIVTYNNSGDKKQ